MIWVIFKYVGIWIVNTYDFLLKLFDIIGEKLCTYICIYVSRLKMLADSLHVFFYNGLTTCQLKVVYDRNHYINLGQILKPKPKLADTFGRYCSRYWNHISKVVSSYRNWNNLALVWGILFIIEGPLTPNLQPNFKYF